MLYNGKNETQEACKSLKIKLMDLVASVAVFACPDDVNKMVAKRGNALMSPNRRRKKSGEARRTKVNGILLDDNTYPNVTLKKHLLPAKFEQYTVCHIWPGTAYDPKYFTEIRNLVLIPSGLHALSDNLPEIIEMLKYRAYELYNYWYPDNEPIPQKPANYPKNWNNCFPMKPFK